MPPIGRSLGHGLLAVGSSPVLLAIAVLVPLLVARPVRARVRGPTRSAGRRPRCCRRSRRTSIWGRGEPVGARTVVPDLHGRGDPDPGRALRPARGDDRGVARGRPRELRACSRHRGDPDRDRRPGALVHADPGQQHHLPGPRPWIGLLAAVGSLVGGLFFLVAPTAAVRQRRGVVETIRRSGRAAMLPGSRHLLFCGLYFFVALPVVVGLAPGGGEVTANPTFLGWVFVLAASVSTWASWAGSPTGSSPSPPSPSNR